MKNEWDEYAVDWDINSDVVNYSNLAFQSLSETINIDGTDIFDFGCGTGLLTERLAKKANWIVALDPSVEMTKVLKRKNLANVSVISDYLTSQLLNECDSLSRKFDLIVASSVCGFLPDYKESLTIVKSMLKPNGIFVQWDWLNEDENLDGMSKETIRNGFNEVGLELTSLTEPFSLSSEKGEMKVLMAVGRR